MVKLLLKDPRVDPSDWNNAVIIYAAGAGHREIVKLLLADPRVFYKYKKYETIKLNILMLLIM